MEHYFVLHGIIDDMIKLRVGVLYLDLEIWKWWECHKKCYARHIAWSQFVKSTHAHFEEENFYLGKLTKLRQTGSVLNFILSFEKLVMLYKELNGFLL